MSRALGRPQGGAGRTGMSLVEMLFAVVLLAVILAAAYGMILQCRRLLLAASDHYVATTLCLARIELARNVDYSLIGLLADPPSGVPVDRFCAPDLSGFYLRHTTVMPDTPVPGLTTMTVQVRIADRSTREFGLNGETISCLFTRYLVMEDI